MKLLKTLRNLLAGKKSVDEEKFAPPAPRVTFDEPAAKGTMQHTTDGRMYRVAPDGSLRRVVLG